jgi:O-antigen ligase
LFDGCRSKPRLYAALFAVASVYLILSLQVIRWVPLSYAISGESLGERTHSILRNEIGFHRTDVAVMLAGGAWAVFALKELSVGTWRGYGFAGASLIPVFALALTAGRAGYVAWAVTGACLTALRWRGMLVLVPVLAAAVISLMPGVVERTVEGISIKDDDLQEEWVDAGKLTAGRNIAWPYVIERIGESPWTGWGRMAMTRTGISHTLWSQFGQAFPHPHNAYLELLLDNGVVGAVPLFCLYLVALAISCRLFVRGTDAMSFATGALSCSLLLSFLVGSFTGQSFYPRETNLGMYCGVWLMLRVYIEEQRAVRSGDWETGEWSLFEPVPQEENELLAQR